MKNIIKSMIIKEAKVEDYYKHNASVEEKVKDDFRKMLNESTKKLRKFTDTALISQRELKLADIEATSALIEQYRFAIDTAATLIVHRHCEKAMIESSLDFNDKYVDFELDVDKILSANQHCYQILFDLAKSASLEIISEVIPWYYKLYSEVLKEFYGEESESKKSIDPAQDKKKTDPIQELLDSLKVLRENASKTEEGNKKIDIKKSIKTSFADKTSDFVF